MMPKREAPHRAAPARHQGVMRRRKTPSLDCYLDDQTLDGPPSYFKSDFEKPKLRKCRFNIEDIDWDASEHIGGGLDGYCWKVVFGGEGPYVLKLFWDVEHPEHYFAPERECQNAAILSMMKASVKQAADELTGICINPRPDDKEDATVNFLAFAKERLHSRPQTSQTICISNTPRMRECYGWLKISSQNFQIPSAMWPKTVQVGKKKRQISGDRVHVAIVYEYVEEGTNDIKTTQNVATFLWQAGFCFTNYPEERNWKHGMLVDLSEIVHVRGYGWKRREFMKREAAYLLGSDRK
ncbi:hypothetical protein FDECE_14334 [Fusarium decemcellulare]|nr:hypothetical protein FDECE_14334 [Fusarium decemcellulare]